MIENTSKNPKPGWLCGGDPGAIERQEAQGQQQLVASSQLPVKGMTTELAAKHGITIIGPSDGDPIFLDVRLPEGWAIKPTDNHFWSKLLDANDIEVAGIFYKAAFYDRGAQIVWEEEGG